MKRWAIRSRWRRRIRLDGRPESLGRDLVVILAAVAMAASALSTLIVPSRGLAVEEITSDDQVLIPFYDDTSPLQETSLLNEPYRGDLTDLIKRRVIRVLVTYDRTGFFLEDGQPKGFETELIYQYRRHLRTRVRPVSWPVTFVFIPVHYDQLLPALESGWGDIVAAGLTITRSAQRRVVFTDPYIRDVEEVIVTGGAHGELKRLEDLAGKTVYVNANSSYGEHLRTLNQHFQAGGLRPVKIVPADPTLTEADILDLLQMGAVEMTVMNSHVARFWAAVHPGLVVHDGLVIHRGGEIAWAVRKDNPELLESLNRGLKESRQGTLVGNILLSRYFRESGGYNGPLDVAESDRLFDLKETFQKYGQVYGFDWQFLAAVAYQESKLNNDELSPAGAVGIMQIRPSTAAAPPISMPDISTVEANIHAGVKYLAHLRDDYFADLKDNPRAQLDFVVAAYNAGPTKIRKLRENAARIGLDANRWFAGVDRLARARLGRETVDYVTKVNKYFIAYGLAPSIESERSVALWKESVPPPPASPPARPYRVAPKLSFDFD